MEPTGKLLSVSVGRIQLLTTVVRCHPQCLSVEETVTTIICLHKLLVNCKLPDVASWLLRCLLALTQIHVETVSERCTQSTDIMHSDTGLSGDQWTRIYTDSLRY